MYKAIKSGGGISIHYNIDEDGPRGTKGLITAEALDELIFFSDASKDNVEFRIKAYCFDHPDETAYLCDHENRILRTFYNETLYDAKRKREDLSLFFRSFVFVLVVNAIAAAIFGYFRMGPKALWFLAAMVIPCLYHIGIVKTRIQNSIEGAVASLFLSALVWILLINVFKYI